MEVSTFGSEGLPGMPIDGLSESDLLSKEEMARLAELGIDSGTELSVYSSADTETCDRLAQRVGVSCDRLRTAAFAADLRSLKGIGPRTAEVLVESGFTSWTHLSLAATDSISAILGDANLYPGTSRIEAWRSEARRRCAITDEEFFGEWKRLKSRAIGRMCLIFDRIALVMAALLLVVLLPFVLGGPASLPPVLHFSGSFCIFLILLIRIGLPLSMAAIGFRSALGVLSWTYDLLLARALRVSPVLSAWRSVVLRGNRMASRRLSGSAGWVFLVACILPIGIGLISGPAGAMDAAPAVLMAFVAWVMWFTHVSRTELIYFLRPSHLSWAEWTQVRSELLVRDGFRWATALQAAILVVLVTLGATYFIYDALLSFLGRLLFIPVVSAVHAADEAAPNGLGYSVEWFPEKVQSALSEMHPGGPWMSAYDAVSVVIPFMVLMLIVFAAMLLAWNALLEVESHRSDLRRLAALSVAFCGLALVSSYLEDAFHFAVPPNWSWTIPIAAAWLSDATLDRFRRGIELRLCATCTAKNDLEAKYCDQCGDKLPLLVETTE
jgi:hypothetical protein